MSKFTKTLALDEATRIDVVSSTVTYVGKAVPGTLTTTPAWKLSRLTSTPAGNLDIEFADNGNYTQLWGDRTTVSYS